MAKSPANYMAWRWHGAGMKALAANGESVWRRNAAKSRAISLKALAIVAECNGEES
jgi:hypothetical protein